MEAGQVAAGVVDQDALLRHAHPHHGALERGADGQHAVRHAAGAADLGAAVRSHAPIVDVGAARLDRAGHAEFARQLHRRRPVGEEELGVDHVEAEALVPPAAHDRPYRAAHNGRVQPGADDGHHHHPRPRHLDAVPGFQPGQLPETAVMRVQSERPGRDRHRVDHPHLDAWPRRQRARLVAHEDAEIRLLRVGE
jgi:hypothetical protein